MEFIIGKDKFPLIEFERAKYAHVFSVTKYQFERYIWETAPNNINYDELIKTNPRILPDALDEKRLKQLFVTGLSFTEASDFAEWLGGRLPIRDEIEAIYSLLGSIKVSVIFDSIKNLKDMDKRCLIALTKICSIYPYGKVTDIINSSEIEDLCSTMSYTPYKPIYIKNKGGWSHVVGTDACDSRIENSAFRVIMRKEEV